MFLNSNPLAEHNAGIALSSRDIPSQNGATGNMYTGQAGRAFVQGGGGMSQFHSFDGGNADSAYARGSYAPVTVGYNSVTRGGGGRRRRVHRKTKNNSKKHKCDIITGVGGRRHMTRCRSCCHRHMKNRSSSSSSSSSYRKKHRLSRSRRAGRRFGQNGGNAAYSIAGAGTDVSPRTTMLANPAPYTAYNSCHPV